MLRKIIAAALVSVMLAPSAFAGWAYSDNGLHWRNWANPNSLQAGEVYFDQQPTAAQLQAAFPGYAAAVAAQQASSTFAQKLSAGLAISCASNATVCTSGITGTYATTAVAQANIVAISSSIASGQGLPGGGSTFQFADIGNALHTFTSAQFLELGVAIRDYVYNLDIAEIEAENGQSPTWPSATAMLQ